MKAFTRIIILIIIITFGIFYFSIVTSLSGSGETISNLKKELEALKKDNVQLTLELSQKTSLTIVEREAEELGLVSGKRFVYIAKPPSSLVVSRK